MRIDPCLTVIGRRFRPRAAGCMALLAATAMVNVVNGETPVDRFLANLESTTAIPAEARSFLRSKWSQCQDCDAEEFLTQGLAVLSVKFREGLDAYDAEQYEQSATVMHDLGFDRDPFIAANAGAYEIKSLVALDRMLEAGVRIRALTADNGGTLAAYSYFLPEMEFLNGFCLLADLQYEAAESALGDFLVKHANASSRLVFAAKQMLLELANRDSGRLGEVVDLMDYSRRRLKNEDVGDVVQTRQKRIIDLLDDLIKQAEEQEKNSSCSSSSGGGSRGGRAPSNPMQQSQLPGGAAQDGALRAARRASPGEVWGAMPPAERQRILQALRDSFPSRYRELVEQYYEELAKKP